MGQWIDDGLPRKGESKDQYLARVEREGRASIWLGVVALAVFALGWLIVNAGLLGTPIR